VASLIQLSGNEFYYTQFERQIVQKHIQIQELVGSQTNISPTDFDPNDVLSDLSFSPERWLVRRGPLDLIVSKSFPRRLVSIHRAAGQTDNTDRDRAVV
jgi:hypothetical protein